MSEDNNCCIVCSRGFYSCRWNKRRDTKKKHAWCWFSVVFLVSLLSLCWIYICGVTFNDRDDINWQGFKSLKRWVNWFMVLIIVSAVLASYCVLLLLFALFQVFLQETPDLHWLHKIFLVLGVIIILSGVTGISVQWSQEWPTVPFSLLATGPFLQFGAVGALTLLSPVVFRGFDMAKKKRSKIFIAVAFVVMSAAIFLCPLCIHSPCLIELKDLPEKPKLIGHRGAPMLAPENTMMSFERSIECGVTAFETDVQLSKDRVPFLMHDHNYTGFLRRTTDVHEKFLGNNFSHSTDLTWEELQSLNAGEWFLKTDPFHSVHKLSEEERKTARNQTIPSLRELLDLAKKNSISVIFDLYSPDVENDTEITVDTILNSGIDPSLILWLPPKKREYVKQTAPGFTQVYNHSNLLKDKGGNYLNVKYSKLSVEKIRELKSINVTMNMWVVNERWLFSLMWCAGVNSVTTNSCNILKDMKHPDWTMAPGTYKAIWIALDIASVVIMAALYIFQSQKKRLFLSQTRDEEKRSTVGTNENDLSSGLLA